MPQCPGLTLTVACCRRYLKRLELSGSPPVAEGTVCWDEYTAAREHCCNYLRSISPQCKVLFISVGCFVDDDSVDVFREQNIITQQLPNYILESAQDMSDADSVKVVLVDGKFVDTQGRRVVPQVCWDAGHGDGNWRSEAVSVASGGQSSLDWAAEEDMFGPCYRGNGAWGDSVELRAFPFWFNCAVQRPEPGEPEPPRIDDNELREALIGAARVVTANGGVVSS